MNANEFLARARGFLASEPVYALHDAGMAVALYAQNSGLHNFMVLAQVVQVRALELLGREGEAAEQRIAPADLRRRCRSPANQPEAIPDDIYPLDIVPTGNYAVSIRWSDNHMSLLPYASFVDGYGVK